MNAAKCPICKRPETPEMAPFCSKRCADVDLSRWLGNGYAIPGEPLEDTSQLPDFDSED